jgi:hypothetical protein
VYPRFRVASILKRDFKESSLVIVYIKLNIIFYTSKLLNRPLYSVASKGYFNVLI